ncbi:MAG TPA: hypothetical protein VFH44_00075 [Solirubrobacterales bacterium]|nr:hypothetical protein [Solirubrobacterales bacterium]
MSAIELGAAALIVFAVALCAFAVVVSAIDAGRLVARRLVERAESKAAHGPLPPASGERSRDPHLRARPRKRPSRHRG